MKTLSYEEIIEVLKSGYVSFKHPNYANVEARRGDWFIKETVYVLSKFGHYEDISDENDDVSVILSSNRQERPHIIYLSLVGRVAYVDGDFGGHLEMRQDVMEVIDQLCWSFIDKDMLSKKAPFPTFIAEDSATIFNVLFADSYGGPA